MNRCEVTLASWELILLIDGKSKSDVILSEFKTYNRRAVNDYVRTKVYDFSAIFSFSLLGWCPGQRLLIPNYSKMFECCLLTGLSRFLRKRICRLEVREPDSRDPNDKKCLPLRHRQQIFIYSLRHLYIHNCFRGK